MIHAGASALDGDQWPQARNLACEPGLVSGIDNGPHILVGAGPSPATPRAGELSTMMPRPASSSITCRPAQTRVAG